MMRKKDNHLPVETAFEEHYIPLRRKEGRILADEVVVALPYFKGDLFNREWTIRQRSCRRLVTYLDKKNRPLNMLEVGCGNGWLSHHLAEIKNAEITGLDINKFELEQANRVFGGKSNIRFMEGDIRQGAVDKFTFDIIVFAASIQYFPALREIIKTAFRHLRDRGEVHILDSHFYKKEDVEAAKKRSYRYFSDIGFEAMATHYFHHSLLGLHGLNYKILHNPDSIVNKLFKNRNPFPWICLKP